ncbi:MAG TPA: aerial mycelium formation protein [Actinomycetota bacterium]
MSDQPGGNRRIDRIRSTSYTDDLDALDLEALRAKRDECLAEREYLSLLRRLVQGRAEILKAELDARSSDSEHAPLIERLSTILAGDESSGGSRGEAVRVSIPEEELTMARRRVERLVADAGISDPSALDDVRLADAVQVLEGEEREVSAARSDVIRVLDIVQDELKRRYKDDPSLALR